MIEQRFKLRRSIIESENINFCDLIERFNYLLDMKIVIIKAILIINILLKLDVEFPLILKTPISNV
jgi:hypothetical protein